MGDLANAVKPLLSRKFPARLTLLAGDAPFAQYAPLWDGFGTLYLHDDGNEVTIYFGNFTHVHCADYETPMGSPEWLAATVERVMSELELTFSGKQRFYGGSRGGGCCAVDAPVSRFERTVSEVRRTWLGPLPLRAD